MDNRKQGAPGRKKRQFNEDTEDENVLQDCLNTIEYLFRFRLIEKIVRPIDKRVREERIQDYAQRLDDLHDKLNRVKN